MERIADSGEYVLYTGDNSYADSFTQILMGKYLTKNKWYKVIDIKNFILFGIHYLLSPKDSPHPYWYPFKSFTLNNRDYMRDKYNLK